MGLLQEIKVPLISVNDTSLTVVDILFSSGDKVKKGTIVLILETSKTMYELEAEADGYIQYLCALEEEYEINTVVAKIFSEATEVEKQVITAKATRQVEIKEEPDASGVLEGETFFSAAAIKLINSSGVDRAKFSGKDFVSKEDVEAALGITTKKEQTAKPGKQFTADANNVIIEKISAAKKREIEYLSAVQHTGLTSTLSMTVETAGVFVHINRSLKFLKDSLLPVVIYEVARLLKKYKELNAFYTEGAVAYYKTVNIGFAADLDKGLKVLKIADTDSKDIPAVEAAIMELSNKYLDEKLQVDDLTGISFTIVDLSAEHVDFFQPLVNMMNSAILGISSIDHKLNRCTLSVTYDHRVTEGKLVARFLKDIKDRIESYQSKYYPRGNQDINCFKCLKSLQEDLSDVGFAKCITPAGEEAYICQSCFKGF